MQTLSSAQRLPGIAALFAATAIVAMPTAAAAQYPPIGGPIGAILDSLLGPPQMHPPPMETPLPRPRPAIKSPPKPKTVLYDEPGGDYWEHWRRFKALADSGNDVEIRGACVSGCTVVMIHVPNDRLCFGEASSLQFHMAREPVTGTPSAEFTRDKMVNQYPEDVRAWIIAKGGVEKMNIQQMWKLDASELWRMGYRKCPPGLTAEEMERETWRKRDERAAEMWREWTSRSSSGDKTN
jgi:hypothetical protein